RQPPEEATGLPGDDLAEELVPTPRELPVHGRPGEPGGPGHVFDRGLGQAVTRHTGVAGLENALPHGEVFGHEIRLRPVHRLRSVPLVRLPVTLAQLHWETTPGDIVAVDLPAARRRQRLDDLVAGAGFEPAPTGLRRLHTPP